VRANCRREQRGQARPPSAAVLHWSLPGTKGDWYAAEAGLPLLLELANLRVLGLDQAELDRVASCIFKSLAQGPPRSDELEDS
jgi:hypothetical protein